MPKMHKGFCVGKQWRVVLYRMRLILYHSEIHSQVHILYLYKNEIIVNYIKLKSQVIKLIYDWAKRFRKAYILYCR